MRRVQIVAISFFVFLAACGDRSASLNTNMSKASEPLFGNVAQAETQSDNLRNNAIASRAPENAGAGGGGREGELKVDAPTAQNISLDKTLRTQVATERKIVRNAELNLESDSPEDSQQKITTIVESRGGFVVESQQSSSEVKTTTHDIVSMTIRVPAEKFGETLAEIRKTANRVIVETVKGEDVTEEFIDIEARLKAQKALEAQFMEIMKRANSVGEALSIQSQLANVRGEIEKVEGRKRFLENQASLSIIKIRLQTPTVFTANSAGIFYRLTESFSAGFDFALNFVLGMVTLVVAVLPFFLLIGLPGYLIIRFFWRKQKRPMSVSEIAQEEIKSE